MSDEFQISHECKRIGSSLSTDPAPPRGRHQSVCELRGKDEGNMTAKPYDLIENGVRKSTSLIRQGPCERHGIIDDNAQ